LSDPDGTSDTQIIPQPPTNDVHEKDEPSDGGGGEEKKHGKDATKSAAPYQVGSDEDPEPHRPVLAQWSYKMLKIMKTYVKFMGPGFMVAVVRFSHNNA
jgi:hypothetical protein